MRTFAQKPKATQQTTPTKSTIPARAYFGQSREVSSILHPQRTIGNQAVQRLLRPATEIEDDSLTSASSRFTHDFSRIPVHASGPSSIQPKLKINAPGDIFEQEADRVADQVMRMPEPQLQRACACGGGCPKCSQEQGGQQHLQTKIVQGHGAGATTVSPVVQEVISSPGQPLDPATRDFMESRFGHDFSQVKVHTNAKAMESTRAVNAQAYTVGQDIAFGEGQYARQTVVGRQLLADELTHVVQQRGASETVSQPSRPGTVLQRKNGAKPAKKSYPYSVTTSGCDKAPYTKAGVEAAAKRAFQKVRDSSCVKTESLKENILAEFNGLNIDCEQGKGEPCGRASRYFTHTVNIYPRAFDPGCPPLDALILHEAIHLTEWAPFGHGVLAWACQKSCFGAGSGDASKCTFETGYVPVLGASAGRAFPSEGTPALYARLYVGLEKRGPILGFVHPSLGIGVGFIGETTSKEPGAIPTGTSTLFSLLAGIRLDPGKPGGGHISFFGGPAVAVGSGETAIGGEAAVSLGYRWRWLDFSLDAGIAYDPTREAGMDELYTLGAGIKIGPSVPR